MRKVLAAAISLIFLLAPFSLTATEEAPAPDVTRILSVAGRFSFASACPVVVPGLNTPGSLALTNGHVIDPRPLDPSGPLLSYRFSTADGRFYGEISPIRTSGREDLSLVNVAPAVEGYRIATKEPAEGEQLWWLSYDWRKRKNFGKRYVITAHVVTSFAGILLMDHKTDSGSSGSCVLNSRGEVVAVISAGIAPDEEPQNEVSILVGVWGNWLQNFAAPAVEKVEQ